MIKMRTGREEKDDMMSDNEEKTGAQKLSKNQ